MRLLRAAVVIYLCVLALSAGVVITARLNAVPNKLEELGFGLCDGEPCFQGITNGTLWTKVQKRFPDAGSGFNVPVGKPSRRFMIVSPLLTDKVIARVSSDFVYSELLPINLGEVITTMGPPCRITIIPAGQSSNFILGYATMAVALAGQYGQASRDSISPSSPVMDIDMFNPVTMARCNSVSDLNNSPWFGFATASGYRDHFQRFLDANH